MTIRDASTGHYGSGDRISLSGIAFIRFLFVLKPTHCERLFVYEA